MVAQEQGVCVLISSLNVALASTQQGASKALSCPSDASGATKHFLRRALHLVLPKHQWL